ncbi:uncharacterized protein LOC133194471 [Saccostrea echinata]|uniref:uncharacterized protein LOC133194471 n=1 Tax=Saccostrea echinata TaxID=191078 RepID=UPI002A80E494|nr:uncharacterized protein LOC133194471 [Saccostrea echinata]
MATPISWAQHVITCDLCDKPTQQFCNNCQVNLCVDCVSKHVDKQQFLTHDIVPYTKRNIQLVFQECEFHPHLRCQAHCQQCDVPVCIKCFLCNHKGHDVVGLSNIVVNKRKEIEKEVKEIETVIIPRFQKRKVFIKAKASKCTAKYEELEQETEKHRQLWHDKIDIIFDKLGSLISSIKDNNLVDLETQQRKLISVISEMQKTLIQNKEILKTNRVSKITNYKSNLPKYRNIPPDIDIKIPALKTNTFQDKELTIELGKYKATLTLVTLSKVSYVCLRELIDKARVIVTIPTEVKPLLRVACVGADKVWLSGEKYTARCVDIHGSLQDTVETSCCGLCPFDIKVTREGDLVYSDYGSRCVNIVVGHNMEETLINTPRDWKPKGLCCTRSGDILVNMNNGTQNKILRYQRQIVVQEIYEDEDGKPIYSSGKWMLFISENNNDDICVSDLNANSVVVVGKTGRVRFRYDGAPAWRKRPFTPRQIVTDSMSHIIVADVDNDCLHILSQDGQFLRCVENLETPCGLSVDSEGRLWVGLYDSGVVKVIQYMK